MSGGNNWRTLTVGGHSSCLTYLSHTLTAPQVKHKDNLQFGFVSVCLVEVIFLFIRHLFNSQLRYIRTEVKNITLTL